MTEQIKQAAILIVDDNPNNSVLLEHVLRKYHYQNVVSLNDSRQVMPYVSRNKPDLLILDINMPYIDGLELLQQLQSIYDDFVPALMVTAQTDDATKQKALELGAQDFVAKPFKIWEIANRIKNTLQTRLLLNQQQNRAEILEQKVRQRTDEIRRSHLEITQYLGRAGEFRDTDTGAHICRVSRTAKLIAQTYGQQPSFVEDIFFAAPLHDVGKIGIPDRILLKPGKLSAEEFAFMQKHCEIGRDIMLGQDIPVINMAREIALSHHEKWDGTGYPQGLQGEAIPLSGRIVAICDVFDALTSERPYKKAWTDIEAINFILGQSGKHFDPQLVPLFESLLPEITRLRYSYGIDDFCFCNTAFTATVASS